MHRYPETWRRLRTVLCHDWLTGMRGGERVLEVLCDGFPDAPILTLLHIPGTVSETITRHPIRTSWIQRIPGAGRHYRRMLPLFPFAVSSLRAPDADLVISTSHCVAKSLRPPPGARHLCYCFTPMRYAWTFYEEYFGTNPVKALAVKPILAALRAWDRRTASRVHRFVAISRHVQNRIRAFYGREADVVYPPVDTERHTPGAAPPGTFDLVVSALVPYKRVDLAVRAYTRRGWPLKVVGVGGAFDTLRAIAGPTVELLGWQPDEVVLHLYRTCRHLIFPGEEDFGIVPLEAQACGRPVVAYARGGALETVRENLSGVFFHDQTVDALVQAVEKAREIPWDPDAIRAHAETFGIDRYLREMDSVIRACLED